MKNKIRTITLTGRRPVKINEDEWPVVAKATGDSFAGNDGSQHAQASVQGELDTYNIIVRQHADGRALVYAVVSGATAWTGTGDYRGGEMVSALIDLPSAIESVGRLAVEHGLPEALIRECIADLPAEDLTVPADGATPTATCPTCGGTGKCTAEEDLTACHDFVRDGSAGTGPGGVIVENCQGEGFVICASCACFTTSDCRDSGVAPFVRSK